ncbi:uncharacterized protein [Rutidosis leptorrhynchoides]|uniref:uncharacterized protein n=1 Tax=Rutidosis leptorrhynchoides TaxID=125765 RepID=UPI003A991338
MSAIDDFQAIDHDNNENSLRLNKEMELRSPDNGFQELNAILKENEPCGIDELLESCIVSKEQNSGECSFSNLATNNESVPNDLSYCEINASPQQMFSPLHVGLGNDVVLSDAQFVVDDERLCSDYLSRSSFDVELESMHNNMDVVLPFENIVTEEREIEDRLVNREAEDEVLDIPTEKVDEYMNNDPLRTDLHSPNTDRASPKTEASHERISDQPLNVSCEEEHNTHDVFERNVSASPRNDHSHRKGKRSVSKSPSRQKEINSRHKRDHRERSRSRSPIRRQHYRRSRSPRRRYSSCRKSPASSYHSRYRSSKQKQWSPPHNRNTGLGKPGKNLFVAGFSFLTTERDLERKFSEFGRVRDVRIVRNKRSGESRGFGFLTLERDKEADAAIRALDKTEWNGRVILVEKSKPQS